MAEPRVKEDLSPVPLSPAQWKRAGEGSRCLPLRQCTAFFCVLSGFKSFQTHHAIHPSYARWLDDALCGAEVARRNLAHLVSQNSRGIAHEPLLALHRTSYCVASLERVLTSTFTVDVAQATATLRNYDSSKVPRNSCWR